MIISGHNSCDEPLHGRPGNEATACRYIIKQHTANKKWQVFFFDNGVILMICFQYYNNTKLQMAPATKDIYE